MFDLPKNWQFNDAWRIPFILGDQDDENTLEFTGNKSIARPVKWGPTCFVKTWKRHETNVDFTSFIQLEKLRKQESSETIEVLNRIVFEVQLQSNKPENSGLPSYFPGKGWDSFVFRKSWKSQFQVPRTIWNHSYSSWKTNRNIQKPQGFFSSWEFSLAVIQMIMMFSLGGNQLTN